MTEYIVIVTTVTRAEDAERIARLLLEKRLAACAQVLAPMTSWYWWQGKIESAGEHCCLLKSRRELFAEVEAAIRSVHPYEVPEIIALPVVAGSSDYLGWLGAELSGEG